MNNFNYTISRELNTKDIEIDIKDQFVYVPEYHDNNFGDGLIFGLNTLIFALVISIIISIIPLIMGVRKRDYLALLITNFITKTIGSLVFLFVVKIPEIIFDSIFFVSQNSMVFDIIFVIMLCGLTVIEGFLYNRTLKYKKHKGITIAIICNIITLIILVVGRLIFAHTGWIN